MKRRSFIKTRAALVLTDAAIISLAAAVALFLRSRIARLDFISVAVGLQDAATMIGPAMIAAWLVALWAFGAHAPRSTGAGSLEYQRVLTASFFTAGVIGIGCFLTQFHLSRGFFLGFFVIGTSMLLLGRLVLRRLVHLAHTRGRLRTRVLVAGAPRHVDDICEVLTRESWLGHEVVGALSPSFPATGTTPGGVPIVGHSLAVSAAIDYYQADAIVFAEGGLPSADDFRRAAWALEDRHVQMIVVPALTDVSRQRVDVRPVAGLPLMYVERPQRELSTRVLKRGFDIVASIVLLVLTAPLTTAIALAIRADDRGPVLFRQARVGRDGKVFTCLKFRSMIVGAEAKVPALADADEGNGVLFKVRADPRITRVGAWLRRYSLDELPQLANVVRGDMSLVGPRPPLPSEVARYSGDVVRRLRVRPGLTGLWQVSGRSDLSWEDTVRLDLYYADNWSATQDLQILARTVKAVVTGRGAY